MILTDNGTRFSEVVAAPADVVKELTTSRTFVIPAVDVTAESAHAVEDTARVAAPIVNHVVESNEP